VNNGRQNIAYKEPWDINEKGGMNTKKSLKYVQAGTSDVKRRRK
jgi:hypothetical protein